MGYTVQVPEESREILDEDDNDETSNSNSEVYYIKRLVYKRKMSDFNVNLDDNLERSWSSLLETMDKDDIDAISYSSLDSEAYYIKRLIDKRKMCDFNANLDDNLECSWSSLLETSDEDDHNETLDSSSNSEVYYIKRLTGKKKMDDLNVNLDDNLECSWTLLSETLDEDDIDETSNSSSDSEAYSGPS